jgi:folylpolyglutamate synthase/dihydropteroate synthase
VALGCDEVIECASVDNACARAVRMAGADDAVLVTGSLYVVGTARPTLKRMLP